MQTLTTQQLKINPIATLQAWLGQLAVPVSKTTIRQTLENHPDFPSLLSLSETLDEWQVDNAAIQLGHVEQLRELPTPFVAYHTEQKGYYILVQAITNGEVSYMEPVTRQYHTETLEEFSKHWSGVVLLAEKTGQSGEADYAISRQREIIENLRWPLILTGTLFLVGLGLQTISESLTSSGWLWFLTKSVGLGLSLLLIQKELGYSNDLTDRLCSVTGKAGCDVVLNAPAATLGGMLSWSDVGLVYFSGSLLMSLLAGFQPILWSLVGALAILALPYTVFSLYYQGVIARQWCTLCLGVQAVLLTEGILAVWQGVRFPTTAQPYGWALAALLLPAICWLALKPVLQIAIETGSLRQKLARFKNNPDLFAALLQQQAAAPSWLPDSVITLGNPDAKHVITVVTNPYCGPCAAMHEALETLLARRTSLKANVIFTACDGPGSRSTQVLRHLLALPETDTEALTDWYKQPIKDYAAWVSRWPTETETVPIDVLKQHCDWCQQARISATPTVFVDGYILPDLYRLDDLKWVLSGATTVSTMETT